ncbi:MAG TPA: arylesterase [Kiloniellales bacterium]|jgi:acyl-CoA thioesterase-1|nr:arylesterase [Kiloniellales bacterium]
MRSFLPSLRFGGLRRCCFLLILCALGTSGSLAAQASEVRLLAFGDSLVHGYGLDEQDTFPAQLEAALRERGHQVQVINGGNSGDTSAAGLARLNWALIDDPHAIIVVLGANDALRGIEPAETYANLSSLLSDLEDADLPTLLAGMMAPRNMGAEYAAEFDSLFPRLAAEHDLLFYPFFLEGVAADPELNQSDGMHPNSAGVSTIVASILPTVEELLTRAADGPDTES